MEKKAVDSYNQKQSKIAQYSTSSQSSALSHPQLSTNLPQTIPSQNSLKPSRPPLSSIAKSLFPSTPRVDLSDKLGIDNKLNNNEHKYCIDNNLCLYCRLKDHKVDRCLRKQLLRARLTTLEKQETLPSENLSENQSVAPKTQHKLRVMLNSFVQLRVQCISMHPLFLILILFVYLLFLLQYVLQTISSLCPSKCW